MKNININCPINQTGYGITSLNIVKNINDQYSDIKVNLFPINTHKTTNEEDKNLVDKLIKNSHSFDYNAPCIKIWHQFDLASRIGNGHLYSFPFFEIDRITELEKHHLNYCDFIFVASHWAKEVLQNNNITRPIYVAPLGVDHKIFNQPPKIRMERENYIFFHIGKWEHRKSQDFLIKAFEIAFNNQDKVELWLLPFNPFLSDKENDYWFGLVENSKLKDKIKIFDRLPTQYHVAEFIFNTDCGVFLSRAEGWNNEIVESMAMNKPIIATNYSAHTEYCNNKNCYLVDIKDTEPAIDNKWFNGFGNWAKLGNQQLEQTINYLRFVYNNRIISNPEGLLTANQFSWGQTAKIITSTLLKNNSYYANTKKKTKRR